MLPYIGHSFILFLAHVFPVCCFQLGTLTIFREFGFTYKNCIEACNERPRCLVSKYNRRFLLCMLFDETHKVAKECGTWIHEKILVTPPFGCINCSSNDVCLEKDDGIDVCLPNSCVKPVVLTGTSIRGNVNSFGSKIKYECKNDEISKGDVNVLDFRIATCFTNGSWTRLQFSCACSSPHILHGDISLIESSSGQKLANISCHNGYELRQSKIPKCTPEMNVWEDLEDAFCDKMVDGPWRKIYSLTSYIDLRPLVIVHWRKSINPDYTKYVYRNDTFIDNWLKQEIYDLKLSVISDGIETAFVVFNGTGSDKYSWFTKDRLLYSSWSDLTNNSNIRYISWFGKTQYDQTNETVVLRHYINKIYSETHCEDNYGWFVVTKSYFPCGYALKKQPAILYSKYSTASRFVKGKIGVADRFEVWVN